jgi:hypothetical protein
VRWTWHHDGSSDSPKMEESVPSPVNPEDFVDSLIEDVGCLVVFTTGLTSILRQGRSHGAVEVRAFVG